MSDLEKYYLTRGEAIQRIALAQSGSITEELNNLKERLKHDHKFNEANVTNEEIEKVLELLANRPCNIQIREM